MSRTIQTQIQTYQATVTLMGDYSGGPSTDFEVALGSYDTPGAFLTPDSVTVNGTTSVTLMARLGNGLNFDPIAGSYWLWGRETESPDLTLVRGTEMLRVVTTLGHDIPNAVDFATVAGLASEATARADGDTAGVAHTDSSIAALGGVYAPGGTAGNINKVTALGLAAAIQIALGDD